MMWLLELVAMTVARYVLSSVGIFESLTRTVTLWLVASIPLLWFFVNIRTLKTEQFRAALILYVVIGITMLLSVLFNPALAEFYTRSDYGLERIIRPDQAMFAFLFFCLFDDPNELDNNITKFAFVAFVYRIVVQLLPALSKGYWIDIGPQGQELHFSYNLSFGYAMTFPTVVFIRKAMKEKKIKYTVLALIGAWSVLTQGNRGALLVLVVYIGLSVISNIMGSESASKKALKIAGIIIAMLFVAIFGDALLDWGFSLLSNSGLSSSRNIELLLQGKMTGDNGRELIWLTVFNAIKSGGIFGHGILGDRPFVFRLHYAGYSHNLFLELLCSLGIIGAGIIVYIIIDAIRMIFFCKDTEWRELYIILFSVSCQLMLSMSFWYVWEFWAAAAIAYKYRKLKRNNAGYTLNRNKSELI